MPKQSDGKIWPYAIVGSIILIIFASIATIVIAVQNPVEMSDMDMQDYHHYDANANEIITAQIAFKKKYNLTYASHTFKVENAVVSYRLTDTSGNAVDNAKFNIMVTRPGNHNTDLPFEKASKIDSGLYTFEIGKLPLEGRWNVLAKVVVGEDVRYLNLKVDTRNESAFEY